MPGGTHQKGFLVSAVTGVRLNILSEGWAGAGVGWGATLSGCRNCWVLKPAGKSRGRGIKVLNQLEQIMNYIGQETPEDDLWVAQKYMENPMLVKGRKFDIRQVHICTMHNCKRLRFVVRDCRGPSEPVTPPRTGQQRH